MRPELRSLPYHAVGGLAEAATGPTGPASEWRATEDILSRGSKAAFTLRGLPEMPLRDITYRDVSLSSRFGADLAYGERVNFERVRIQPAEGAAVRAHAMVGSRLDLVP